MTERYPRRQVGRVPRTPLKYQYLDFLRRDTNEEIAIDQGQLHRQDVTVYIPNCYSEIHS